MTASFSSAGRRPWRISTRSPASAGLATRSAWTRWTEASGRGGGRLGLARPRRHPRRRRPVSAPSRVGSREDLGVLVGLVVVADARADDVGLAPLGDLLGDPLPGALHPPGLVLGDDVRRDGRPPGGELAQRGGLHVAEDRHRHGPRDRRRGHDEDVRGLGGLAAQGIPLLDAEAVLLVDDDEREVLEAHVLLDEGVRADDDAGVTAGDVEHAPGDARRSTCCR